jgi:hypothetical protein
MTRLTRFTLISALGFAAGWMGHQRWGVAEPVPQAAAAPALSWAQRWDEGLRIPDAYARATQLHAIAIGWAKESPAVALTAVQRLTDGSDRWMLLTAAVTGWAQQAPQEAADWVLKLEPSSRRSDALTAALDGLAAKDPPAAVALAGQLPQRERGSALQRSLVRWADKDLPSAMQYLERLPDSPMRDLTIVDIARGYAERDLDAAITWGSVLPPAQSAHALRSILDWLTRQDPMRAAGMLAILEDGAERRQAVRAVALNWAGSDAPAALAWALQQPLADDHTSLIEAVFNRWCEYDAAAASRRLLELQDPSLRDAAAIVVATNQYVPIALAQQAHQLILDEGIKRKISGLLYNRMQGYGYDAALLERYRQEAGYRPWASAMQTLDREAYSDQF